MTNEQLYDWYFEQRDPFWSRFERQGIRRFNEWPPRPLIPFTLPSQIGIWTNVVIHDQTY